MNPNQSFDSHKNSNFTLGNKEEAGSAEAASCDNAADLAPSHADKGSARRQVGAQIQPYRSKFLNARAAAGADLVQQYRGLSDSSPGPADADRGQLTNSTRLLHQSKAHIPTPDRGPSQTALSSLNYNYFYDHAGREMDRANGPGGRNDERGPGAVDGGQFLHDTGLDMTKGSIVAEEMPSHIHRSKKAYKEERPSSHRRRYSAENHLRKLWAGHQVDDEAAQAPRTRAKSQLNELESRRGAER